MTDAYLARWLRHADRDLHVANNELHTLTGDVITEAVCFHAQQAAEKYLKGYLVARQISSREPTISSCCRVSAALTILISQRRT